MSRFAGVCCDPGWGPGGAGTPDPAVLAASGVRRVRIPSRKNLDEWVTSCWSHHIWVRAVVLPDSNGYLCPADEYVIWNEPNLNGMSPQDFTNVLKQFAFYATEQGLRLIAGALGDNLSGGIDAAAYIREVRSLGGLDGYSGVALHYPSNAGRVNAVRAAAGGLPVHVTEFNPEVPGGMMNYVASVLAPYAVDADFFCWSDGMRDAGWTFDMGLIDDNGVAKPMWRALLAAA